MILLQQLFLEMTDLAAALDGRDWSALEMAEAEQALLLQAESDERTQALEALVALRARQAYRSVPAAAAGPQFRSAMQDWVNFPFFLTEPIWEALTTGDNIRALQVLCEHLKKMGLKHPSEPTQAVVAALLQQGATEQELRQSNAFYQTVKAQMRMLLGGGPAGSGGGGDYVISLTAQVGRAPAALRLAAEETSPIVPPRVDMLTLCLGSYHSISFYFSYSLRPPVAEWVSQIGNKCAQAHSRALDSSTGASSPAFGSGGRLRGGRTLSGQRAGPAWRASSGCDPHGHVGDYSIGAADGAARDTTNPSADAFWFTAHAAASNGSTYSGHSAASNSSTYGGRAAFGRRGWTARPNGDRGPPSCRRKAGNSHPR